MRCMNRDDSTAVAGRKLCSSCEKRLMDSLILICRGTAPLLSIAPNRPARDEREPRDPRRRHRMRRHRCARTHGNCIARRNSSCGWRQWHADTGSQRVSASTVALAHAVLKRSNAILTVADAATWASDINAIAERIRRTLEPSKPKTMLEACPACGAGVWGEQASRPANARDAGNRLADGTSLMRCSNTSPKPMSRARRPNSAANAPRPASACRRAPSGAGYTKTSWKRIRTDA